MDLSYINHSMDITYGILMPLLIGIGLIGNFIYFWCLSKNRKNNNSSNSSKFADSGKLISTNPKNNLSSVLTRKKNIYLYIKTLSFTDFFICINSIIVPATYLACYHTCRKSYIFALYATKIGFPLMDFFTHFNYMLRVFVSLDRLWALEFPFTYKRIMSSYFIKYLIILGFTANCLMIIPYSWGYIVVKVSEVKSTPILYNPLITNNTFPECALYLDVIDDEYIGVMNNTKFCQDIKYVIKYTHLPNPKTIWFQTYRKWITFIMTSIPFMVTSIANFFVVRKCYKILHNRNNLKKVNNKVITNKKLTMLAKCFSKILFKPIMNSRTKHGTDNKNTKKLRIRKTLTAMKKREFQITILITVVNLHFVLTTIPITLYMFMYQPWTDMFSSKAELWFQNLAYISKYGNNAMSVYINLFFDPTVKIIFSNILERLCHF
ncbi:unnamed protein product [Gordionus sp. m RMFG-2023]